MRSGKRRPRRARIEATNPASRPCHRPPTLNYRRTHRSGPLPADRRYVSPTELLELADQCVKCGLCLPHCPTYAALADEGESPRGRIALIQGWASGRLGLTPRLEGHLDRCLTCRACEVVCPSLVAYGRLMDGAKAARVRALPPWRRGLRLVRLRLLAGHRSAVPLAALSRLYGGLGLARLAQSLGLSRLPGIGPWLRVAAVAPASAQAVEPSAPEAPDLELFVGCTGSLTQGRAFAATRALCEHLGLRVRVAPEAGCCGALFRHNGFPEEAARSRAAWIRHPGDPPLVGLASACVAELRECNGTSVLEICDYLDRRAPLDRIAFAPLSGRVLVHEPCSHRYLLKDSVAVYRLLGRIPGLDAQALPGNDRCCGAAGTYLLGQPALSRALLAPKLAALRELGPNYLVTTNPGCALHLAAGIREAGLRVRVCHPTELLWQSVKGY